MKLFGLFDKTIGGISEQACKYAARAVKNQFGTNMSHVPTGLREMPAFRALYREELCNLGVVEKDNTPKT